MNAVELIQIMNRNPFEPFEIFLNDGSRISVDEPFQIATRRNSPACVVYDDDEKMRFVAYRSIAQIVTKTPQ